MIHLDHHFSWVILNFLQDILTTIGEVFPDNNIKWK